MRAFTTLWCGITNCKLVATLQFCLVNLALTAIWNLLLHLGYLLKLMVYNRRAYWKTFTQKYVFLSEKWMERVGFCRKVTGKLIYFLPRDNEGQEKNRACACYGIQFQTETLQQWFPTFFDAFPRLLILELFIPPLFAFVG